MTHASAFRALHQGPRVLLLANVWDAGTARLVHLLGAPAIATTSAGMAWSHGFPDGDALPVDVLLAAVRAIARVVDVPLSVDIERGYSDDPATVARTVAAVIDAGAVGINIEDGLSDSSLLARKIERIRREAAHASIDVFINARTDVFLRGLVSTETRVAETVTRAARYRDAGADGLFVPGLTEPADIRAVASWTSLPLNLLTRPGLAAAAALAELGVRRLSSGSVLSQSMWGRTRSMVEQFLDTGDGSPLHDGATTHAHVNACFATCDCSPADQLGVPTPGQLSV